MLLYYFTLKIKTRSFLVHDNFYVPLSIETAVVGFAYWLLVGSIFCHTCQDIILLSYTQTTSCYGFIYFLRWLNFLIASFLEAAMILIPLMVNSCCSFGWHLCLSDGTLSFGIANGVSPKHEGGIAYQIVQFSLHTNHW